MCRLPPFSAQVPRNPLCLLDGSCDAEPAVLWRFGLALTVDTEGRVDLAFDEVEFPFAGVSAPRLDGEWLVDIVIFAGLFIGVFDDVADCFGGY